MSSPEHVVHVPEGPLAAGIAAAFNELNAGQAVHASVVFPAGWRPSVDVVPHIVAHAQRVKSLQSLVLVHQSVAMGFIASTIALSLPNILVRPARSASDTKRRRSTITLTGTVAILPMRAANETPNAFIRRASTEMREKGFKDVVIAFTAGAVLTSAIGDILVEELLQNNTLHALGLVHPTANLDVIASSVRLRISRAKIVVAPDVATAEHLVMLA